MQVGKSFWMAGLGLAVAGVAGCAGTYDGPYRGASSSEVRASADDATITQQIQSSLARDPNLDVANSRVSIRTEHGRVALSGDVPSERDRQEAADIASRVPGVTRVDNDIDVRG